MRDYRKDIRIDETDLMKEWLEQPSLYLYYSDMFAAAVFEKDRLKLKMEWVASEIDSEIRADYHSFGFDARPTEAAIKNAISQHKKYRKAHLSFLKAAKNANLLLGVKTSFEHRKKALENAVSLQITGFHSEPRNKVRDLYNKEKGHETHKEQLNKGRRKLKSTRKKSKTGRKSKNKKRK